MEKKMTVTRMSKSSWFKIKSGDRILHFDPGYSGLYENQGIPENELEEKADLILVTHSHKDHLQPEALEKIIQADSQVYGPKSCFELTDHELTVIKPGDHFELGKIKIIAVDAYNTAEGHSTQKAHHKGDFVGYLVNLDNKSIYFAGDTDLIPEMNLFGKVDIAFLPIGGTYVMDLGEALEAVKVIQPEMVIPMHHANSDMNIFAQKVLLETKSAVSVLGVGDTISFALE